jgi:hypothetical protein
MRKKDHNVQESVGSVDGEKKEIYYYHERSAVNTISKDLVDKKQTKAREIIKKKQNHLIRLLNVHLIRIKKLILKKYKIDLIVTDCTDMNQKKLETYTKSLDYILNTNLYKLFEDNHYKLINWVNSDLVFVRKNLEI